MSKFRVVAGGFVVFAAAFFNTTSVLAQTGAESTRFAISGAPIFSRPQGVFHQNIGSAFGGTGAVTYRLDRPGIVALRFDLAGVPYGQEKRRVSISPEIGDRVLLDVTTTNWMTTLSFGPEVALPKGPVRPYFNFGFSQLFFRTTSSLAGSDSTETFASSTNYSDATAGWFTGGGVRIPIGIRNHPNVLSLDLGLRYHKGGNVSYLSEGGITDNPDGSITVNPLTSGTPQVVYQIGVRIQIPHNPNVGCHWFLC